MEKLLYILGIVVFLLGMIWPLFDTVIMVPESLQIEGSSWDGATYVMMEGIGLVIIATVWRFHRLMERISTRVDKHEVWLDALDRDTESTPLPIDIASRRKK